MQRQTVFRLVAAALCSAGLAGPVKGQISPGKLAKPHQSLEGVKNCLKCHALGQGPSAEKCLECHKEIAVGIDGKRGYHHRVVSSGGQSCFECHNDHAGREFELVHWPGGMNSFKHAETGYKLQGAHDKIKCRKCHIPEFIAEDLRSHHEHVDVERTFLGLTQACLGCHTEEHRKQLATDCLQCHNYNAWKPAPLFDHDKTEYTLTGKHRHVKCSKCHPVLRDRAPGDRSDASYVKYAGIDARTCSGCHQDVHRGKLGSNCATCHRTSGWLDIAGRNFDHSRTRFPLKGLHARVPCEKCHGERRRRKEVAFAACSDCHKDPHQRQFASYADGGRCETCHSEEGFLPSLFTLADHEKTRYPLTGSHLAQPCIACHTEIADKRGARRRYKFDDKSCEGCHEDVHVAQFKQHGRWRPVGQEATPQKMRNQKQCQDCHRITFWTDLDFDHDRDTSYSLVGAHRNVRCQGCHLAVGERGKRFVRYRPIGHACKTCHDIQPAALN